MVWKTGRGSENRGKENAVDAAQLDKIMDDALRGKLQSTYQKDYLGLPLGKTTSLYIEFRVIVVFENLYSAPMLTKARTRQVRPLGTLDCYSKRTSASFFPFFRDETTMLGLVLSTGDPFFSYSPERSSDNRFCHNIFAKRDTIVRISVYISIDTHTSA